MVTEHDPLIERMRAAAPVRDADLAGAGVANSAAGIAREIAAPTPSRRQVTRRRRIGALAVAGALVVGAGVAGAAYVGGAHTGVFGSGQGEEVDHSEWLDTGAADFGTVVEGLVPDVEMPPGTTWQAAVDRIVANGRREPGLMQATGVRSMLEFGARCAWLAAWLHRHDAGDAAGAAQAVIVLRASETWPAVTASDGGGVIASFTRTNDAAQRGSRALPAQEFRANCTSLGLGGVR